VLASLNHPHIAAIYGVEESDGVRALVMELVEGRDLSDLIAQQRGDVSYGLDLLDALPIARQIAEALDAAHSQGIVHRDLKPANVKVRTDDTVKVLDFGLAKPVEPSGGSTGALAATLTSPAVTQLGVVLGTAAYMSPEQARGKPVDKRADIWAFGCVLFEMLTARRPFEGETMTDVLSAIVRSEPDWTQLPRDTPPRVRALLARCLQKDPAKRLRDIGDAIPELSEAMENHTVPGDVPGRLAPASPRRALLPWTCAAVAALVATTAWVTRPAPPADRALHVWNVDQGPTLTGARISPDGTMVAFIRSGRIAVRRLSDPAVRELDGTDEAATLFWSPDSTSIGYITATAPPQVRLVAAAGGPSAALVGAAFALAGREETTEPFPPGGGTFCGQSVVFSGFRDGLVTIARGEAPRLIVPIDRANEEGRWAFPSCLPDGRLLATLIMTDGRTRVVLVDGSARRVLFEGTDRIAEPVHAGSGHVVFQRGYDSYRSSNAGIWALPVSPDLSAATGPPVALLPDGRGATVSASGVMVAMTGVRRMDRHLVWVDRTGARLGTLGRAQRRFYGPAVSPDGSRVAVMTDRDASAGALNGIWLYFSASVREWSPQAADQRTPAWSPDGARLAYRENQGVMVRSVDGSGAPGIVVAPGESSRGGSGEISWSPDGRQIVYVGQGRGDAQAVMVANVDGTGEPTDLVPGGDYPAVSPDGTLLAYVAFTLDRDEVFVTTFPTPGPVWPVSVGGGRRPRWNPKGGELFFTGGPPVGTDPNSHRDLFAASVERRGARVAIGPPRRLFDASALGLELTSTASRAYDIAPDGQRIILQTDGVEGVPAVTVFDSLPALLKALK
jgi:eukaryotic-like serine/threonine-protein kinase